MAAVQASVTMLAAVEVGEAAEFRLHGLPQGLADDPELRMFATSELKITPAQ